MQDFLKARHPAWNLVGRVHFNLAENRKDEAAPFAFLATYTTRLSAQAKAQHLPLGKALQEYAGAQNRERLLSLLMPVQRAAERCPWLKAMVDAGDIFHPLRWTARQALQLLRDAPAARSRRCRRSHAGQLAHESPATARGERDGRRQAAIQLGMDALLDFQMEVTLDGERLCASEIEQLLAQLGRLALIRGKWVEIDRERLAPDPGAVPGDRAPRGQRRALVWRGDAPGRRRRMGRSHDGRGRDADWARRPSPVHGWRQTLAALRRPEALSRAEPRPILHGTLRPYQQAGVQWLHLLPELGLGACLADDMGLGKTIQVLSLFAGAEERERASGRKPSLLVAPASLLANWAAEIERFAPSLGRSCPSLGGKGREKD